MASPLGWFRRNQKGMLVVFGSLLMAAFGLASVVTSLTPTGGNNPEFEKVVVQWKGGELTNGQIADIRTRHFQTVNFLRNLQRASAEKVGDQFRPGAMMIDVLTEDGSPQQRDREVFQRYLAVRKASEMGIQVGDATVMDYLKELTGEESLTQRDLEYLTAELYGGRVDFIEIKNQLKQELAINQILRIDFTKMSETET